MTPHATGAQLLTFRVHLKGVQAQTVANFYLAFEAQLAIIPVINKVNADTRGVKEKQQNKNNFFEKLIKNSVFCCGLFILD